MRRLKARKADFIELRKLPLLGSNDWPKDRRTGYDTFLLSW
jgi:hypothetical protein